MKYFVSIKAEYDFEIEAESRAEAEKIIEELKKDNDFIRKFTIKSDPLIIAMCSAEEREVAYNALKEKYPNIEERMQQAAQSIVPIGNIMDEFEKRISKEEMEAYMSFVQEYGFGFSGFGGKAQE